MKNLVLGMRLALPDFQRGGEILDFNPELTKNWEDSLKANNYEYELLYVTDPIQAINLGGTKIIKTLEYLKASKDNLDKVLLSDTLDVVVLKDGLFEFIEEDTIYVGNEPVNLGIEWIKENSKCLLKYHNFNEWFNNNKDKQLLNTGLIAGKVEIVIDILEQIKDLILKYCKGINYGYDMICLNYVVYNSNYKIIQGEPFNTVFKRYDHSNKECFISHK